MFNILLIFCCVILNVFIIYSSLFDCRGQQIFNVNFQELSHFCQRLQVEWRRISTPFGDVARSFPNSHASHLLVLLDKHNLDTIDIFHVVFVLLMLNIKIIKIRKGKHFSHEHSLILTVKRPKMPPQKPLFNI